MSATDLSRRELAHRALLAGGAAVTASSAFGVAAALAQTADDTSATDSEILVGLVTFERQTILAYEAAIASKTLGDFTATAAKFAEEERAHEARLLAALAKNGGEPQPAPRTDDVPGLTQVSDRAGWLTFLIGSENQLVAAYVEGQKEAGAADVLTINAENCSSVGQHLVSLRQALGTDPLPSALPSGSEKK